LTDQSNEKAQRGRLGRWLPAKGSLPLLRAGHGRSDMVIIGSGLALAIGCALFPWYVFFNQDKFGVQAMNFSGSEAGNTMPSDLVYPPELIRRELNPGEIPLLSLDTLSTGTLPDKDDPSRRGVPLADQPFPGEKRSYEFSLVHVANGRAMIEDEDGLWVVQKGSTLPDASKVASIEKRDGAWVLVTDAHRVIPIAH
jgi:hypothetical protein